MPSTRVVFYQDDRKRVPVLDWLEHLRRAQPKAYAACVARIILLKEQGHELRRPHADYLEDGIYELRARQGTTQYRILYFFHGQALAVLVVGTTKEAKVDPQDLKIAKARKTEFEHDPGAHTYGEDH